MLLLTSFGMQRVIYLGVLFLLIYLKYFYVAIKAPKATHDWQALSSGIHFKIYSRERKKKCNLSLRNAAPVFLSHHVWSSHILKLLRLRTIGLGKCSWLGVRIKSMGKHFKDYYIFSQWYNAISHLPPYSLSIEDPSTTAISLTFQSFTKQHANGLQSSLLLLNLKTHKIS